MEKIVNQDMNSNPRIIDFLDYREYLREKFKFFSSTDKKYSIRWLAKKAGINSPQLISMVLKGERKLSKDMASSLSYALELSDDEEEYLLLLIDLQDSKIGEHREEILQRIRSQFHGGLFKNLERDDVEYLSKWYYPVVRESVGIPQEKNLKKLLGISQKELEDAYKFLTKLGLLKFENGSYLKDDQSLWFKDNLSPMAMMKFHFEMLSRSLDELKVKKDRQHFETLTISVSNKKLPELKKKMHKFICEIDTWLEEEKAQDNVIQLNVNFFSWLEGQK